MRLRNLNGSVRNAGDKITVTQIAPDGRPIRFKVPRSAVIEGLNEAWGKDAGMTETELTIDSDGALVADFAETPSADQQAAELEESYADDDLLGGGILPVAPAYDDDDLLG